MPQRFPGAFRTSFRLFRQLEYVEFALPFTPLLSKNIIIVRHRFERIIAGRCYLIEVAQVEEKRWRANILKLPGVPGALMPFYGETPDEAAELLTLWLDRAHQHRANTV